MRHLGETRALAAEQIAHVGARFRLAATEGIDPFALRRRLRRRGFTHGARADLGADLPLRAADFFTG